VWESQWWRIELAPLERLTCKQPHHISRAPTRNTVCKKTSGEDARGLRPTCFVCLYDFMYMYTRKEPTSESWKTQAWGRTPLEVNTNCFFFILNRCQCLIVSSFPNAPCFLLFCDDDSFFPCSITVSVFSYPLFQMLLASFLFCFRLFYAYELVEDDVGEETIGQTSTAEQSGPLWSKWPVLMSPLSTP